MGIPWSFIKLKHLMQTTPTRSPSPAAILEEIKESVAFELSQTQAVMNQVASDAPGEISQFLNQLVSRPGKKMRATFLTLIAKSGKEFSAQRTANTAASIELLHLATLVHDDVIDNSEYRRNEITAHKKWGTKIAILLGDYALAKSLELIIMDEDNRIPRSVSQAASRLIAGEILETQRWGYLELSQEAYLEVISGKTASLWEACAECGALLAKFPNDLVEDCIRLGRHLGLAFQIIDDLLDYGIGAGNLGKKQNSDIQNGLITLPLILYFEQASKEDSEKMKSLIRSSDLANQMPAITETMRSAGCFLKSQQIAQDNIKSAQNIIEKFPDTPRRKQLLELCSLMADRSA